MCPPNDLIHDVLAELRDSPEFQQAWEEHERRNQQVDQFLDGLAQLEAVLGRKATLAERLDFTLMFFGSPAAGNIN